jgi:hypothetical protein
MVPIKKEKCYVSTPSLRLQGRLQDNFDFYSYMKSDEQVLCVEYYTELRQLFPVTKTVSLLFDFST